MKNHWKVPLALLFALASFAAVLSGTNTVSANRYEIRAHQHYKNGAGGSDSKYVYGIKYVEADDPKTIVAPEIEGFYPDPSVKPLIGLTSIVFEYLQNEKTGEVETPKANPVDKEQPEKEKPDSSKETTGAEKKKELSNIIQETKVQAPSRPAKKKKGKGHRWYSRKMQKNETHKKTKKCNKKLFRRHPKKRRVRRGKKRYQRSHYSQKVKNKGKHQHSKSRHLR